MKDRFEESVGTNVDELASASGVDVNDVMPQGDYAYQSAKGNEAKKAKKASRKEKLSNIVSKIGGLSKKVEKAASVIKGGSDAFKKTQEKSPSPEDTGSVISEQPSAPKDNKKIFIIGGIAIAVALIGFIVFKIIKKKE